MPNGNELCAGDYVRGVEDLFRLLRRGREYLVEADRQLRGSLSLDEEAAREAWYADMDANDEWTGYTAEAHAACVHDIILCFEENADAVKQFDGRVFLINGMWEKLDVARSLAELRSGVAEIEMRIAQQVVKQ